MNLPIRAAVDDEDVNWASHLLNLKELDAPRREFLKDLSTVDVSACPGSGKTTLVVAKLAILSRKWSSCTQGICVLSHTNVARREIESRLGSTDVGQRLLGYPHYIDTIHGFIGNFIARPWLHSTGHEFAAFDDDLTTRVRRSCLSYPELRTLDGFLKHKNQDFRSLRLESADFSAPITPVSFFGAKEETPSYKIACKALRLAAEQGYFCFDEVFVLARALINEHAEVSGILARRFPFVIVDEMQDTSEDQGWVLSRVFPRSSDEPVVQRVGDPNQAIFDGGGAPQSDSYPDVHRTLSIGNSFRFDDSVARLATNLACCAVEPAGLCGVRVTQPTGLPHTVFVFPDDDTSGVLEAFGNLVISTLDAKMVSSGTVAAIGEVHKPVPDVVPSQYPKTVSHYFPGYEYTAARQQNHPKTLVEYFRRARVAIAAGEPANEALNSVARGITQLARLAGTPQIHHRSRQHRLLEFMLLETDIQRGYRDLMATLLLEHTVLSEQAWRDATPVFSRILAALGATRLAAPEMGAFLAWSEPSGLAQTCASGLPVNTYRCVSQGRSVDIRLSSIHKAKGETHLATLLLETFNFNHFFKTFMDWLLGKRQNGVGITAEHLQRRLRLFYVAMTRPSHLVCLAVRHSSIGADRVYESNIRALRDRGWQVTDLSVGSLH